MQYVIHYDSLEAYRTSHFSVDILNRMFSFPHYRENACIVPHRPWVFVLWDPPGPDLCIFVFES